MEKAKVIVYGRPFEEFNLNGSCTGSCDTCGSDCGGGNNPTQGELFDMLKSYVDTKRLQDLMEIQFINIDRDDMSEHPDVTGVISMGYALPLTSINGRLRMYGGINPERIEEIVRQESQEA